MNRSLWSVLWLVACAAPRMGTPLPHDPGATCPDDHGCELVPAGNFGTPDEDHPTAPAPVGLPTFAGCAAVGATMASLEAGNYADADVRAPLIQKYERRCLERKLDSYERQCAANADDQATLAYCAARLVPEVSMQIVDVGACDQIARDLREVTAMGPSDANRARYKAWLIRMDALERSCREDRWPVGFATCARSIAIAPQPTPACLQHAPAPLRKKLEERLVRFLP